MNIKQSKDYFNTSPVEYTLRTPSTNDLKEDREYMPKFSFKSKKTFKMCLLMSLLNQQKN